MITKRNLRKKKMTKTEQVKPLSKGFLLGIGFMLFIIMFVLPPFTAGEVLRVINYDDYVECETGTEYENDGNQLRSAICDITYPEAEYIKSIHCGHYKDIKDTFICEFVVYDLFLIPPLIKKLYD